MESHPKAELLASFVEGRLEPSQARAVVAHLLHGCAECTAAAQRFFRPLRNLPEGSYNTAFDRAHAKLKEHLPEARRPAASPSSRGPNQVALR